MVVKLLVDIGELEEALDSVVGLDVDTDELAMLIVVEVLENDVLTLPELVLEGDAGELTIEDDSEDERVVTVVLEELEVSIPELDTMLLEGALFVVVVVGALTFVVVEEDGFVDETEDCSDVDFIVVLVFGIELLEELVVTTTCSSLDRSCHTLD